MSWLAEDFRINYPQTEEDDFKDMLAQLTLLYNYFYVELRQAKSICSPFPLLSREAKQQSIQSIVEWMIALPIQGTLCAVVVTIRCFLFKLGKCPLRIGAHDNDLVVSIYTATANRI